MRSSVSRSTLVAVALLLLPGLLHADVCTVPGSHANVQEAIDDPACTELQLADQIFTESIYVRRSLLLIGANPGATTIEGRIEITGTGTVVELRDLRVESGCPEGSLDVWGGAEAQGSGLVAVRNDTAPCPALVSLIFEAGFESGNTSSWSSVAP